MLPPFTAPHDSGWLAMIAALYFLTNAARIFTYIPQVVVVWRCKEGARSVSLLTWGSWVLANCSATAYGLLVLHDRLFVTISLVNLVGCAAVAAVAARRRAQWKRRSLSLVPRIATRTDPTAARAMRPAPENSSLLPKLARRR